MSGPLDALRSSVDRLAALVAPLDDSDVARPAYPADWTIAQVCSHLGSGAELHTRRISDLLAGVESPDDLNERTWAAWEAKSPREAVDDGLTADTALVALLSTVPPGRQASLLVPLGPMELPFETFVATRLAEHVVHEWDVAVALDPAAPLASEGLDIVLDRTLWLAGLVARPLGEARTITIATSDPEQSIAIVVGDDEVRVESGVAIPPVDLMMPTESFVRLVYGRLDPDHTPNDVVVADASLLDQLRSVFPGL
ncbi:MAG TPA: maleylpyruvate isomerase family mycothiol-dependent enzyme [Acidimicrobiales bacterium]